MIAPPVWIANSPPMSADQAFRPTRRPEVTVFFRNLRALVTLLLLTALLLGCDRSQTPSALEQVKQRGELIVATRNSPTTYYEGPEGPTGFEYELVSRFAEHLGVELSLITPDQFSDVLNGVENREVDLAAAGLSVTKRRERRFVFGPVYQKITPQVIYHQSQKKPRKLADLVGGDIDVVAGSSHADKLLTLRHAGHPLLAWNETADMESEELLRLVNDGFTEYTVADSNEVAMARRFYTNLRVAFDLSKPESLAWAFPKSRDRSLVKEAEKFFKALKASGDLAQLHERFYGHVKNMSPITTRSFVRHANERLPALRPYFEAAAKESGFDWRLLAAIAYQESQWDPKAVSPTGVRGIMMLTLNTAKQVGIKDRRDPEQSIIGGARYFKFAVERIPERIAMPDRLWFAMAAYNVGYGHLEDARILAQKAGGDPDRWHIVEKYLPLLSKKKWYSKTRYGYARGGEPVVYVRRIRRYYDLMIWYLHEREFVEPKPQPVIPEVNLPGL